MVAYGREEGTRFENFMTENEVDKTNVCADLRISLYVYSLIINLVNNYSVKCNLE